MARKTQNTKAPRAKRRISLKPKRAPGGRAPKGSLIVELAAATETDRLVLAAVTAAHSWTDETRLTRDEFVKARDEWLTQPGRARPRTRKVTR